MNCTILFIYNKNGDNLSENRQNGSQKLKSFEEDNLKNQVHYSFYFYKK